MPYDDWRKRADWFYSGTERVPDREQFMTDEMLEAHQNVKQNVPGWVSLFLAPEVERIECEDPAHELVREPPDCVYIDGFKYMREATMIFKTIPVWAKKGRAWQKIVHSEHNDGDAPAHELLIARKNVEQNVRVWVATEIEETERDGPAHELVRRMVRHRWDPDWLYETLHRLVARHPVDDVILREVLREDDRA